jgi:hypothetical protein
VKLQREFEAKYGDRYQTVRKYFAPRKHLVDIRDMSLLVPELLAAVIEVEGL